MSRRIILVLAAWVALSALSAAARGEQYWIAYEGNDYPENEGWTRYTYGPGGPGTGQAQRRLEDGALVIDSTADIMIADFYQIHRPGQIDPGPGETFVLQWRMRLEDLIGHLDPSVGVFSDDDWGVGWSFTATGMQSAFELGVEIPLTFNDYHDCELRSADMRTYALFVDGQLARNGSFWFIGQTGAYVTWGDSVQGGASISHWDYARFGVIPEPSTAVMLLLIAFPMSRNRRRFATKISVQKESNDASRTFCSTHHRRNSRGSSG